MRVHFTVVGFTQEIPDKDVLMQQIPRKGDQIMYPIGQEFAEITVRTVVWYAFASEPYAHVVLGPAQIRGFSDHISP